MDSRFLGKINFTSALELQDVLLPKIAASNSGVILGFECEPVITLGLRASVADVLSSREIPIVRVDRGGQATVHNPGQLVIFPLWPVREIGVRDWICRLSNVSRECLKTWNVHADWDQTQPGLYTERGKIMACGIRVRRGISTHGLAINVCNHLTDFAAIRACGSFNPALDKMGEGIELKDVFSRWVEIFRRGHS